MEYDINVVMENVLNRLMNKYKLVDGSEFKITATIRNAFGVYLGCRVVWLPRDKHLHPITLLTEYGIIKVRSHSGDRLVKTVGTDMCDYFDALAQQ